jgi:molecular chaperone HtpG
MSSQTGIIFQVDTDKILNILTSEIYDSPLALLRENLQNAYDAVRMRFVPFGAPLSDGKIDLTISGNTITITDNGIGMNETVLTDNFWKPGSSGKRSDDARRAGVVGTFGIGAMANFGVSTQVTVRTRAIDAQETLISSAERAKLKIAEKCISLDRVKDDSPVGTTVTVHLLPAKVISPEQARRYLEPYVEFLPVPVYLNGQNISGKSMESRLPLTGRTLTTSGVEANLADATASAQFHIRLDQNGQVLIMVTNVRLAGVPIDGSLLLLQNGGQLMGLRSYFGLAPIPCASAYQFGGFANLSFLQPTAGREAVSRDSIDQVARIIALADRAASEFLSDSPESDKNTAFMQWLVTHGRQNLAKHVTIRIQPDNIDIPLSELKPRIGSRVAHYYTGSDPQTIQTFSGHGTCLFQIAQGNPRRGVQLHWLQQIGVQQIPDSPRILRTYKGSEMGYGEGSIIVRSTSILRDDYLVPDIEVLLSDISHGVSVLPLQVDGHLVVHLAKASPLLPPLLQVLKDDYQYFPDFMKDFVRNQVYPRIQQFVPSSTRQGVDALRKILERNRELYRYEETETGELESMLQDLLPTATMAEIVQKAQTTMRVQTQRVTQSQVGTVENVIPDVAKSPSPEPASQGEPENEFSPRPPILREEITSDMKILIADAKYPQLNNFSLLLGLSDRLMREYADFFRTPHTTRILWGGHRVIYIFSEPTGRLSLYYDVELREPLEESAAGGALFPTTTLITKKRIFVPVPDPLVDAFKITAGPREFYVRFDLLVASD